MTRIQFNQGVMMLSSFDPSSNQVETRILSLPDPPVLESLEHLFTSSSSSSSYTITDDSDSSSLMIPRKRYTPSIITTTTATTTTTTTAEPRRSLSRRSLSRALRSFTGLLQSKRRCWRTGTWITDMPTSSESARKNSVLRRRAPEAWWAASPPLYC